MKSLKLTAAIAITCYALLVCASVVTMVADGMFIDAVKKAQRGEGNTSDRIEVIEMNQAISYVAQVLLSICAVVSFIPLLYKARRNLEAAAVTGFKYSRKWVIASWFVPGFNLFRPYQIMREIWKGSVWLTDSEKPENWQESYEGSYNTRFIHTWWLLFILGGSAPHIARSMLAPIVLAGTDELNELLLDTWTSLGSDAWFIALGIYALIFVIKLTRLQEKGRLQMQFEVGGGTAWA